jgi:hypothetical protein
MKRIVDTYPHRVLLEFTPTRTLVISVFGRDGWQTKESLGDWDHDWEPDDIADGLVRAADVQRDEAERIQREVLQQFEDQGGWSGSVPDDSEYPRLATRVFGWSVVGIVVVAVLVGIWTIASFLWDTFPTGAVTFAVVLSFGIFLLIRSNAAG